MRSIFVFFMGTLAALLGFDSNLAHGAPTGFNESLFLPIQSLLKPTNALSRAEMQWMRSWQLPLPSRSSSPRDPGWAGEACRHVGPKGFRRLISGKKPLGQRLMTCIWSMEKRIQPEPTEVLLWVSREWFGDSGTSTRNKAHYRG